MSMKSGLDAESQFVLGESPEEFAELQSQYFRQYAPTTPEQRFQVDNLIRNEWLIRRYHRVEAQLWQYQTSLCDGAGGIKLGEAFAKASAIFMRLQRRINAAEKAYKEAREALVSLQPPQEPEETKGQTRKLGSFLTTPPDGAEVATSSARTASPPLPSRTPTGPPVSNR